MNSFNMKACPKYPILFLLLLTTLILPISSIHAYKYSKRTNNIINNDLITSMCQRTPCPLVCESNLRSDPRSAKADPKTLVLVMIDVIKSRFSDSVTYAKNMSESTTDPKMTGALKECVNHYSVVANDDVQFATYALGKGYPKFALAAMEDAGSQADYCKDEFQGKEPPFIVDRTRELKEISAIAVALVKTLIVN